MSPEFREPGFWECLRELLPGGRRPLDCVQVEVSTRCQGLCLYCPHTVFRDRWRGRDMEWGTFERLWPLMRRSARVHLQGWGEPLLNPALFAMAALARKAGCAVSTTTGGMGRSDEAARAFVESGMDMVAFSLAGSDAGGNLARRGVPFEAVCEAVERLQAIRRRRGAVHLEIHFAYLLLASKLSSVRGLPALMRRLGVHSAVVSTLDYLPDPSLQAEAFPPSAPERLAEAEAVLTEAAAEAKRLGLGFDFHLPRWDAPRPGCRENAGRSLFVSAEGDLSPCVYLHLPVAGPGTRRLTFGNIHSREGPAVREDPAYRAFRDALASGAPDPRCPDCPKRFTG